MFEDAFIASNNTHRSIDAFRITLHPVESSLVSCNSGLPYTGTISVDGPATEVYTACGYWVELHLAIGQADFRAPAAYGPLGRAITLTRLPFRRLSSLSDHRKRQRRRCSGTYSTHCCSSSNTTNRHWNRCSHHPPRRE